ncbi:MAG TPA: hypothetical protein VFL51_04305 [Pseudolabrys sp.]|nr:hypothetical protein [Pseudolabrys sp.]
MRVLSIGILAAALVLMALTLKPTPQEPAAAFERQHATSHPALVVYGIERR